VTGVVLAEHKDPLEEEDPIDTFVYLVECSVCNHALVGWQHDDYFDEEDPLRSLSSVIRVWPQPDHQIDWEIPSIVRDSLIEARKCLGAKAYLASAVMCGRALEAVCKELNTQSNILAGGLRELLDRKIIDDRLFQWGEELRKHRNIGAHASTHKIKKQDAEDLFEFAHAICNYIFILSTKFDEFMKRKK
jgi:hypothetical protein